MSDIVLGPRDREAREKKKSFNPSSLFECVLWGRKLKKKIDTVINKI